MHQADQLTIIVTGGNKQVGALKHTGSLNDRDPILITVGGTVPTNMRAEQVP